MLFVLDNYDSFTYNLVQLFGELGAEPVVYRNDALTVEQVLALKPTAAVLSPGPCTPGEAGILVPLVQALAGKVAILGVCLGHQAIGEAFGARVVRADRLMHGKTCEVVHVDDELFEAPQGHRHHRVECGSTEGCGDHGDEAPPPPDLRRAVPSRVDRYLAREAVVGEFSAHRARRRLTV